MKNRLGILIISVGLILIYSTPSYSSGVIEHIAQAQAIIDKAKTGNSGIPPDIAAIITKSPETEKAFRSGALDGDIFNPLLYPEYLGPLSPLYARDPYDLVGKSHNKCSASIASFLLKNAKTDAQKAYAYGWLSHLAGDVIGHPLTNNYVGNGGEYGDNPPVEWDPTQKASSEMNQLHRGVEKNFDDHALSKFGYVEIHEAGGMKYLKPRLDVDIDIPVNLLKDSIGDAFGETGKPGLFRLEIAENLVQAHLHLRADELANHYVPDDPVFDLNYNAGIDAIINWMKDPATYINQNFNLDNGKPQSSEDCLKAKIPQRPSPGNDHPDDNVSVATLQAAGEVPFEDWLRVAIKREKKGAFFLWQLRNKLIEFESLPENTDIILKEQKRKELIYLYRANINNPDSIEAFRESNQALIEEIVTAEDVGILDNGFSQEMATLIAKVKEPAVRISPEVLTDAKQDKKIFIIPSGGLYGMEKSEFFKASLDEYVKNGGTVIVFAQQHGYEFSVLPVPQEADGSYKTIGGFGWSEDQSCFVNAAYIDTWHQMLAGQIKSTPTLHLDGYFTNYPSNATVILRRTANGQPAMLMYEYGQGQVIVTSMYSDFALKQNQASSEEIALVRDMISWAKKPDELPEIKPGETLSVSVGVENITTNDAVSVKLLIYNPNRSTQLSEQIVSISIPAGQSVTIPVTYSTTQTSSLGIYHIDYTLLDAQGNIIQPQAETDSGRFVVSNPPKNPAQVAQLTFSIQSDQEHYVYGSTANFTIYAFNNSDVDRTIIAKVFDGNYYRTAQTQSMTVPAGGSSSFSYPTIAKLSTYHWGQTWGHLGVEFYEGNTFLSYTVKSYRVYSPSVDVTINTEKPTYAKGETVSITTAIKNNLSFAWQPTVKISVISPHSTKVFEDIRTVALLPYGNCSVLSNIDQPTYIGNYLARVEVYGPWLFSLANKGFEILQSQISVIQNPPQIFSSGTNSIPFTVSNTGKVNISSGILDITLKDPDGIIVNSQNYPFSLAVGESKVMDVIISIPVPKFGNYLLTFTQSDETKTGNPTTFTIPNSASVAFSLDKPSYRIRETANLTVDLTNTGKFNLDNVSVTVFAPDANYTDTKTISLGVNPNATSLNFTIPIPETITAGQHNVDVTVTLPSGANFVKSTPLVVPESKLVIGYSGATTLTVGDTISLSIENTGGVDTTYTTQTLSINDSRGVEIYHGSVTGTILTGEKKNLVDIQIPAQVLNGPAYFHVQMRDSKTAKTVYYNRAIEITGLTASLQTMTDKNTYLLTEAITGISSILNGPYGIEAGSMKVSVSKISQATTGQFTQFLPKQKGISFSYPGGVAVGTDGSIYVADTENHRIQKFDSNGNIIRKWGSYCNVDSDGDGIADQSCNGQFNYPYSIAVGSDGSVYVADSENHRIQKFDGNGNFIAKWGSYCTIDSNGDGVPDQVCDGQFNYPEAIAVGPDGSVYVADDNHHIQKFDGNGAFISKWGSYCNTDTNYDGIPDQACDGQFNYAYGIATGPDGSVFVAEIGNHRIQKFDSNGNFITKWGGFCNTDPNWDGQPDQPCNGQFYDPWGIAIGYDGFVYVVDSGNSRVQKFDYNGNFITKWGSNCQSGDGVPCDGQFNWPAGIAVGLDGFVYVADSGNNRVQKFDSNGNFLMKLGSGGAGSDNGEFNTPFGVTVGNDGSIYITDSGNNRIQKFDSNGNFITKWGSVGDGDGQFDWPSGIASGADGSIYVADTNNNRIQKFDSNGNFISKWEVNGMEQSFNGPLGIAVGPDGSVYVADTNNRRIEKFDSDGNIITQWRITDGICGEVACLPTSIAVGPDGAVYVGDAYHHLIQKFDSDGSFITSWELPGALCDEYCPPAGIAVGPDGSVYAADTNSNLIRKFDGNGNLIAAWGSSGSDDGQFYNPKGIAVAPDGSIYVADVGNHRIQRMMTEGVTEILFETTLPINQPAGITQDYITDIGTLNATGKLYLQADLKNSLGQAIVQASYPFYIFEGDTILLFNTDKKAYKPGETVTITGQVENRATIEAVGLTFTLNSQLRTLNSELLYTETFNIPAGGTHPFTITTTAGAEGNVTLIGNVTQNNSTLVEITDQYEVTKSKVSIAVSMPDVIGSVPFDINVEIRNTGKIEATVQFGIQSSEFGDSQTITIPPGEIKIIQYSQQISENVLYTFTFTGDYQETITKTVTYGLGASIQFGVGSPELGVFSEGNVAVPVTLTNTGQSTETLEVIYQLNPGAVQQSKIYSLPVGGSTTDTLYFNLTEGDYQISATSQRPDASAQASLSVRKENQVQMGVSLGTQADGLVPVMVNLTNVGFNEINGGVSLTVTAGSGQLVWSGEQTLSQLAPQNSQLLTLNINPSAIDPGNYNVQVTLLSNSNQPISTQSLAFGVQGATFQITQLPPYQTLMAGQEATFVFRVRNIGDQEGSFDLRFKAYDLIDSTQREFLKAGEEKAVSFNFMLPEDLEERDYFADYELKASVVTGQSKGQVKYHLAGINLSVNATLDKPYYTEGETAHLTVNIQTSNPNPQNLFARVNYAGYEPQQTFTLSGSQVLIFDVPLPKITGEKLFYGIYHEGGRSIHLNSVYIHKAGDVITITTDKQVYNAGETVSVSVSGNASGNMTLSGPGGYTETFAFSNQANKSFALPSTLTAGTYFINVELITQTLNQVQGDIITVVHPFDVAGIQVKVLECNNDKGKYASSDNITTSFTISSNTAMPAILKAWIVDPTGQYTSVGELSITLSSSESSLITYNSALSTSVSGIHRLVYGIYGPEDLLLCSGSEAFDVGDAVLMGISTDKKDYPTNTEPVTVTASLYGSVSADLQLELDGNVVKIEPVSLNGFTTYTTQLQNIIPGPHTLKGTLTAGGLKSTKETSFTYALAYMPKPQISAFPAYVDFGIINLGSTSTQSITLSSTGNVDLVIGTIALSGSNQEEFSIQNDNCSGRTIAPSGSCTLDVLFSPTSLGVKSASLFIPSNATEMPTLYLPLDGTGATNLNVSINPTGSGRVTGTGIDCPGDCTESFSTSGAAIQLTATPAEGYVFTSWTGDINITENPVTMNMDTNKNVTANFSINTYTINVTVSLGGNITPSGSITVNPGGSQTFIVTPNPGYYIVDVRVDGVSVGAVTTYTISNITSNHTIEVIFAINQYTITAAAGSNGAISPLGTLIVNYGGSQIFFITPDAGYHVADVKVDGVSVGAVTTFTFDNVTSNHTIEASFDVDTTATWAKTYGGQGYDVALSARQTGDGGYIVAGESWSFHPLFSDAWVIKLDATGSIQWQKRYGGSLNDVIYSIEQTQDGGYIMAGETNAVLPFLGLFWVVKINANGEVQWQKTYSQGWAHSIQQTSEGGYVATGMNMGKSWIVKLNANGAIQWQKKYAGILGDLAQSVQQTSEGGYIVAGMMKGEVWVLKLNSVGETQWQKTYGNSCVDASFSIQQTQEGGYIMASVSLTFGAGYTDIWIVKLDPNGAIEWQKTYGGSGFDLAYSIQQTQDGGYVVAGWTGSFGAGDKDAWVLKLDANGEIEWQKTYGGSGFDMAHSIQQTQDGGYVVAGWTETFGAGDTDMWVLKLDANGNMSGCPEGLIGTTSIVPYNTSATMSQCNETGQTTYVSRKSGSATVNGTTFTPGSVCGD